MKNFVVTFNDDDYLLLKKIAKCMNSSINEVVNAMFQSVVSCSMESKRGY